MSEIPILWKPLSEDALIPKRQREGDAGYDLYAAEEVTLKSLGRHPVKLGFAAEFQPGAAALILPRSGLAVKSGITVVNAPGLIDSNYRGEWMVGLVNLSLNDYTIHMHDRIAQVVLVEAYNMSWSETNSLSDTERGDGAMGSSGRGVFS